MPLAFKGVAHPPAARSGRDNIADLDAAEIHTTNLGRGAGTQLLMEHDHGARVGTVLSSWQGPHGELRVQGLVDDPVAMAAVRDGTTRGLSLGTSVIQTTTGQRLMAMQDELSLCEEPKRGGCYIDEVDGASVRTTACFSSRASGTSPPLTRDKALVGWVGREGSEHPSSMSEAESAAAQGAPTPMETSGVSTDTYNASKKENDELRAQLAALKAKSDIYDTQKREAIVGMKAEVNAFIGDIVADDSFAPYKHELQPMQRWGGDMEKNDTMLDTNLSIGRLISCASAKFKRTREEASRSSDASTLLSDANKRVDELTMSEGAKAQRISELEGLVEERTKAAEAFQNELAKANLISEKKDFSNKSARENGAGSAMAAPLASMIDPNAALMSFLGGGPSNGGLKIMQSGTGHNHLGATIGASGSDGIAEAIRGF